MSPTRRKIHHDFTGQRPILSQLVTRLHLTIIRLTLIYIDNFLLFHDSTYHTAHGTPGSYSGGGGGGIRLQEIRIEFERGGKGLGLSIAGGLGSTPYKLNDEGIFISRVTPGGPAHVAGLCKDDKVRLVTSRLHSC